MAKEKTEVKKHKKSHSSGEVPFGLEVILFVIAIFIIWLLTGGAKTQNQDGPLLSPDNGEIIPNGAF